MKKVLFLFPPCIPSSSGSPYLAPHLLSTILREKGHEVENRDLNREFVARLCRPSVSAQVEKHLLELQTGPLEKNLRMMVQAGLANIKILSERFASGTPLGHREKITYANYILDILLKDIKTIADYRDKGLDIAPVLRDEFTAMVDEIDFEDRAVCISCAFGDQLPFSLELGRLIKKRSPKTQVLLGGAQISLLPPELIQEISRFRIFNLVFTGYAEEKISEAVEGCTGEFFTAPMTGSTATARMLEALPFTRFDEMDKYERPMLPVMVNKGCYWGQCSFCDYIVMGDLGGLRFISRSVEKVFAEIRSLREQYPECSVQLISDAVPPKFYTELCRRANQENFPLKTYSYMINNKNLTEEFFTEASRAQIGMIVFGTESTNDRVLALMQKQGRRKDILENFRLAEKYGVPVKVNLIPNYPTTTYQEAMQALSDISFFQDAIHELNAFKFYLSANTEMDKRPENYDLEIHDKTPYMKSEHNGFHSREFSIKGGMTPEQEDRVYMIARDLSAKVGMTPLKKKFKETLPLKGTAGLRLTGDFRLIAGTEGPMLYCFRKNMVTDLSQDDYRLIRDLEGRSLTFEAVEKELGPRSIQWFEHYFCLGIFDFAA